MDKIELRRTIIKDFLEDETNGSITQESIKKHLEGKGIEVSIATLSRDIAALEYIKEGDTYRLANTEEEEEPKITRAKELVYLQARKIYKSIDYLAVSTYTGQGRGTAVSLKRIFRNRILGTIAGDNMVLLIIPAFEKDALLEEIAKIASLEIVDAQPPLNTNDVDHPTE